MHEKPFYRVSYKKMHFNDITKFFVLITEAYKNIKESTVRIFKHSVPYKRVRRTVTVLTYRTHAHFKILGSLYQDQQPYKLGRPLKSKMVYKDRPLA